MPPVARFTTPDRQYRHPPRQSRRRARHENIHHRNSILIGNHTPDHSCISKLNIKLFNQWYGYLAHTK